MAKTDNTRKQHDRYSSSATYGMIKQKKVGAYDMVNRVVADRASKKVQRKK